MNTNHRLDRIGSTTRVLMDGTLVVGLVRKNGRTWEAELVRDGRIVRFAGIWNTKRDAIEEAASLLADRVRSPYAD